MKDAVSIAANDDAPAARERVLTTAVLRVADHLAITGQDLASILGVSPAAISRMRQERLTLKASSKSFELAAMLVRLFRSLDALTGGDVAVARAWLANDNRALGGVPREHIRTIAGLTDSLAYLDSRRAPL